MTRHYSNWNRKVVLGSSKELCGTEQVQVRALLEEIEREVFCVSVPLFVYSPISSDSCYLYYLSRETC